MKIAHISTINTLKTISGVGDIEFCLIPFTFKSKEYYNYFNNLKKNTSYFICDDSIAENGGELKLDDFVKRVIEIKGNEIIIPDTIGNYKETKKKREKFLDKYYNILKENNIKIQSVIQGETIGEYEECLKEVNSDNRIDIIGVPFRMNYATFNDKTKEQNHMLNRILFLNVFHFMKPVHCLGCNLPEEYIHLNHIKHVRSCDSKLVARYGLNLQKLSFEDITKPQKKLFLEDKMDMKQLNMTMKNISILQEKLKW